MLKFNVWDKESRALKGQLSSRIIEEMLQADVIHKQAYTNNEAGFKVQRRTMYGNAFVDLVLNIGDTITLAN